MKNYFYYLVLCLGIFLIISSCGGPLYQPGDIGSNEKLKTSFVPPDQSGVKEGYWKVEDNILLYHFSDRTGTPVLIIHGGPGYPPDKSWEALNLINQNYEFIYYHQRGCGKSSRPLDEFESKNFYKNMITLNKTLGIGAQLADIERIRKILEHKQLILIGHSFGAFLASLYAAEFPENVKAMVLVAPADVLVMPSKNGGLFEQVGKLLPENLSEEYQDYLKRYFDYKNIFEKNERELSDLNLEFTKYYSAALKTKDLNMESQTTINESGGWMVLAMYFSMGKKHDYREALNEVSVPVLVIHGENDIMPVEASQLYANILPNSKLTVIKNASHFSYDEQPEEFAKIVESFLIQVSQ